MANGASRTAPWVSYLMAVAATAAAGLLRWSLSGLLGEMASTVPFVIPIALASWYGGLRPGLLATALGAVVADYLFAASHLSLVITGTSELVALGLFVVGGVAISWLCGSLHDARLRAERAVAALRESEERFRASQEASPVGFAILTGVRDESRRVVDFVWHYVNPAAAALLQRPSAALVGRRLLEVLPGDRQGRDLFAGFVRVVETGEPRDCEIHYGGEGIDGWFRTMTVKLGDGVAVGFTDVTERYLREQELRASEAHFRHLADSMPQIVWVADPDGRIVYLNRHWSEVTGRTVEDGLGECWCQSVHPDDLPGFRAAWEASLRGETPLVAEYRLRARDGQYRWQVTRGVPVRDGSGRLVRWYGSSTDIDEPKRLAEALSDADRKKDQFLATLAHELRNPLAPIRNAVQLLRLECPPNPDLQAARDMIDRQVRQMVLLIDDLLDVSRITLGKLQLRRARVDLASVVADALEVARPLAERAGHELSCRLPAEPVSLLADPARLAQVFGNLLTNACKYTDRGGRISLTASREGGEVVVTVSDNGIGIAAEHLPRVFEMFSQAAPALERSQGGLGIGLALVRGMVEMHGGTVTAHSGGPGQGSQFVVRLKAIATNETPPGSPRPAGTRDGSPATARRVLLVDDNRDSADSLAMLLRVAGHTVETANDGLAAVEAAERLRPELLFLDLGMPRLNGYDACRRIRQQPWGRDVTVIALTGWGSEEDRRRTREAGFDHHLVKPLDLAMLEDLLTMLGTVPDGQTSARAGDGATMRERTATAGTGDAGITPAGKSLATRARHEPEAAAPGAAAPPPVGGLTEQEVIPCNQARPGLRR